MTLTRGYVRPGSDSERAPEAVDAARPLPSGIGAGVTSESTPSTAFRQLAQRGRGPAGALAAPFVQASSSLVLQVIAIRELGAEGFGVYALLYSGVLMAMALSNGLVGDSFTVLDRRDPRLRGALLVVGVASTLLVGGIGFVVAWATGLLSGPLAALFAVAMMAFLVENLFRRVLMSVLMFWRLVMVDAAVLVGMLATVGVLYASSGDLTMGHVLTALLGGQLAGIVAGLALVPESERWLGERSREVGPILRFGSWRASQQAVRPSSLTAIRAVVVVAVGTSVFGELEAARVYTAPTMLLVSGAASYFLASYSARPEASTAALRRRADVGAAALGAALLAFGVVVVVLLPVAGGLVSGNEFDLEAAAVGGWVAYAAGCALIMPYASLASVRGAHARMVGMRLIEAVASLVAVGAVLALDISAAWVPLAIAISPLALVPVIRRQSLTRTEDKAVHTSGGRESVA